MRKHEIIQQCAESDEEVVWARKGRKEAIVLRKSLIYFVEKGMVADIRDVAKEKLRSSDKLEKYFMLAERIEKGEDRTEAFVSARKTTPQGKDCLCIENMEGDKKWIDKSFTDNFAYSRKYWFDTSGWNKNLVLVEEGGVVAGIIMTLDLKDE